MSHWLKAHSWLQCGAVEDCRIEAGQPYLLICVENSQKIRCERHAGRAVDPDWDQPREKPASSFRPVKDLASGPLRFDARQAQAGKESD